MNFYAKINCYFSKYIILFKNWSLARQWLKNFLDVSPWITNKFTTKSDLRYPSGSFFWRKISQTIYAVSSHTTKLRSSSFPCNFPAPHILPSCLLNSFFCAPPSSVPRFLALTYNFRPECRRNASRKRARARLASWMQACTMQS